MIKRWRGISNVRELVVICGVLYNQNLFSQSFLFGQPLEPVVIQNDTESIRDLTLKPEAR